MRVRRPSPTPRPQGPYSRQSGPSRARTAPNRPSKLPSTFRSDAAQGRPTKKQQRFIDRNARQQRRIQRRKVARARAKYFQKDPAKQLQHSTNRAISAFAQLQASDPKAYERRGRSGLDNAVRDVAGTADKAIHSAGHFIQKQIDRANPGAARVPGTTTRMNAGLAPDITKAGREVVDIVANTPTGLYQTGAAAVEAAKGDTKRASKLIKDFKDTSALASAAQGHWKEALHRAEKRPVTTALELSGTKALIGRGGGAVARSGVAGRRVRSAASLERPNLKLYDPDKEGRGPEVQRKYSKDVINKGLQKAVERRTAKGSRVRRNGTQRRPARDPHVDRGVRLVPPNALGPDRGPWRRGIHRRLDERVFSQHRVLEVRRRKAAVETKKALKSSKHRAVLERATKADHVRAQLREELKDAQPGVKKQLRGLVALPDDKLLAEVERNAKPHLAPRAERMESRTPAENAAAARALDRRARRGQSLTPRQKEAVHGAVGKQIQRDVGRRNTTPPYPGAAVAQSIVKSASKGSPNLEALNLAFRKAGGGLPVVARPFKTEQFLKGSRGGYRGIKTTADGKRYHLVYYNPRQGVGAANAALWHELGHAIRKEKGFDQPKRRDLTTDEYKTHPEENFANEFMGKNMDTDLFAHFGKEGAFDRRATARNPHGISPLTSEDFGSYLTDLRGRRNVPRERVEPTERDRQLHEAQVSDHDIAVHQIRQAHDQTLAEHQRLLADEFGLRDHPPFKTSKAAQRWADKERPQADAVPFKREDGDWTVVPRVVHDHLADHAEVDTGVFRPGGTLDRSTNIFKDVVLTSASPAKWLGGNIGDIGMRTLLEGITPMDIVRGVKVDRSLKRQGLQGEEASANMTGGGLYGTADDLSPTSTVGRLNVPRHVWRAWKKSIYTIEHAIEKMPQHGRVGKTMRQDTARAYDSLRGLLKITDEMVEHYAKNIATDRAMEARLVKQVEDVIGRWGKVSPLMRRSLSIAPFAQWLGAATRYVLVTLPVHHPIATGIDAGIMQMTEKERIRLGLSYFSPDASRAPDYQMGMLPIKVGQNKYGPTVDGIRTSRMTSLGTAAMNPSNLPEFLLPQISSGLNALRGLDFTGQPMLYPPDAPESKRGLPLDVIDRLPVAVGAQAETMVPFASAFRRSILEQGRPADPSSTILTPEVRKKYDYQKKQYYTPKADTLGGIREWLGPYAGPPFTKLSRIYTQGAGRDIAASQQTMQTLKKWNAEKKTHPKTQKDWFAPGASTPKVKPKATPTPEASWFK